MVTVATYAAVVTVLGAAGLGATGPGVSAAALAMLYRRLSGVILVSIVQKKEEKMPPFFFFHFVCGVISLYTSLIMQNMNGYMITVHF